MTNELKNAHGELMRLVSILNFSAASDGANDAHPSHKTEAVYQKINAYAITLTDRIAELQAQLEAVGAGGVEALISNAERKSAATLEPFGYFKAEPFGWTDCSDADEGAIALYEAPQPQQVAEPAQVTLEMIADILGTGSEARKNHATLINCIENAIRRSDCLSRIERGFFMVPTDDDEDEEPGEECLLNWGQSPDDYAKQFGEALDAIIATRGTAQVQAMLAAAPAPPKAETPLTGNEEVDRIIARLDSSDPDFDDCAEAVALFIKMVEESKGPDGFASWKDAAIAARISASPATAPALDDGCQHGSKHIVHDCMRCGAPVCCGKCCSEDAKAQEDAKDEAQITQASIDSAPEPFRRLGKFLARTLDEDQWATAQRLLLGGLAAVQEGRDVQSDIDHYNENMG